MIDFNNASFVKLRPVNDNAFEKMVTPILVEGETLIGSYQSKGMVILVRTLALGVPSTLAAS